MGSLASSEPIMQKFHAYLLFIQLYLIEKKKLFFDLGNFYYFKINIMFNDWFI